MIQYYFIPYFENVIDNGLNIDFSQFDNFTVGPYKALNSELKDSEGITKYVNQFQVDHSDR